MRDTNRCDEARATLAEIYNWFTEGFDTADLKDAKSPLDQLTVNNEFTRYVTRNCCPKCDEPNFGANAPNVASFLILA